MREVNGMAVVDSLLRAEGIVGPDEVWVHGMWTPDKWARCLKAVLCGRRLVRMTHGSLSPVYLGRQGVWKKRLAKPIERLLFALCDRVVVTGPWEAEWNRAWGLRGPFETIDMKQFFDLSRPVRWPDLSDGRALRVLYLGRRHPLKGVAELEAAVEALNGEPSPAAGRGSRGVELRIVSNAFDAEREAAFDWCDVLCLPTLSENFGLVVAEALERGRPAIVTDGAPAWEDEPCEDAAGRTRLVYVRGYRDGTDARRVALLKDALGRLLAASTLTP